MNGFAIPQVTVVTASFNSAATIADTIRSVNAQTGIEVEHIIIDGGSSDATLDVAKVCGHNGPVIHEPDNGIYDAMNKGLRVARGEYVGFLNSDDYFAGPASLARLFDAVASQPVDAMWGNVMQVDADGRPIRLVSGAWAARGSRNPLLVPPHPSFYARTELLRSIGGFATRYRIAGDVDLLFRLFALPSFAGVFINELTTIMRVGGASASGLNSIVKNHRELAAVIKDSGKRVSRLDFGHRYALRTVEGASGMFYRLRGRRYLPFATRGQ